MRCLLWCRWRDLNPHGVIQRFLRPSCLPIPPHLHILVRVDNVFSCSHKREPAPHILTQAVSVDNFTRVGSQGKQYTEITGTAHVRNYVTSTFDTLVTFLCLTCRQSRNVVIGNLSLVLFRQYTFFLSIMSFMFFTSVLIGYVAELCFS